MMPLSIAIFVSLAAFSLDAAAASKLPPSVARYLKQQGPVIQQQLFESAEPRHQLALYYCVDENLPGGKTEGASNPANVHCHVSLFNRSGESWTFASKRFLGQGKVFAFSNGIVTAESVQYKSDDPLCCPSDISRVAFTTNNGKLIPAKRAP